MLAPWKKSYDKHSVLKSRDITLLTKVHIVKAIVFPVVMYGCESGTIEKTEHQRIDAFELWCWRRLLRVPWAARRSNQLLLKEINIEHSLEGLMLKLKLQYFGHLMQRADSLEKTLMLGKTEGKRRRGVTEDEVVEWAHQLNGDEFEQTQGDCDGQRSLQLMGSQRVGHNLATEQQQHLMRRGFLGSLVVKNPLPSAGDVGFIPGSGRYPGEGNGIPLQYSCLGCPMDRGAWWAWQRFGHDLAAKQQQH